MSSALPLHVEREGEGPPVLLLHGFTGSTRSWREVRERLRVSYTVLAVDLPGHGQSPAPNDPSAYALTAVAEALVCVLDREGIARAVIVGYSMGGRTALRLALAHPGRCAALVLESTSGGIADRTLRQQRRSSDDELAAMIEREGVEAFVNRWERLPMWHSQSGLSLERRQRLREERLSQSATGLANSLRGAGAGVEQSVLEELSSLTMPVLLVAGAMDEPYVAHARAMAARLPNAKVHIEPNVGHAIHLESPERLASLIRNFVQSRPS